MKHLPIHWLLSGLLALLSASCISTREVHSLGEVTVARPLTSNRPSHFICWNVHKASDEHFTKDVEALLADIPKGDGVIMCMQEVRSSTWDMIKGLHREKVSGHYAGSWRFPFSQRSTGVLTVSNRPLPATGAVALRSPSRELYLTSPKVSLATTMPLPDGRHLRIVNCHGLNFVAKSALPKQLDQIFAPLKDTPGPAIVCGDFNAWSSDRLALLIEKAKESGLKEAPARGQNTSPASRVLRGLNRINGSNGFDPEIRLDRIFTREIEVLDCYIDEDCLSSDHQPLILRFRVGS
jgi:endonuclease/exonuclease/phosphatase (EEP) superfamily protein YafD